MSISESSKSVLIIHITNFVISDEDLIRFDFILSIKSLNDITWQN